VIAFEQDREDDVDDTASVFLAESQQRAPGCRQDQRADWLCKEATDEDLKEIAEIVRRNDQIGDFRFAYNLEPREMIFCALESRRGYCRYYSQRLRLHLISPTFEVPFTETCTPVSSVGAEWTT
jgi:hypothetical protein